MDPKVIKNNTQTVQEQDSAKDYLLIEEGVLLVIPINRTNKAPQQYIRTN